MQNSNKSLFIDFIIVIFSIAIAIILVQTEILQKILTSTIELEFLGSFIAGIFFTSIFTLAPATIVLGQIAAANSIISMAIFGAMGAVVGDLIIFKFVRDSISEHLNEAIKNQVINKSIRELFKYKLFRWTTFLIGGLIIASPLPDELGISLLGILKIKTKWFIYISFIFNFIGLLFVGTIAKAL